MTHTTGNYAITRKYEEPTIARTGTEGTIDFLVIEQKGDVLYHSRHGTRYEALSLYDATGHKHHRMAELTTPDISALSMKYRLPIGELHELADMARAHKQAN